ncbi:porin family protein [bacterium]|nr:porin family protein [bacterium]MBU1993662.1 porin family protein [bacterium]
MKKIILFLLLISSLYSDAKVYIGSSYGFLNEDYTNGIDAVSSAQMAKLKVGYGDRDAYAIEFSLEYIENNSKIFSANDKEKYGFNVELVKALDFDIMINPFFKAGFGAGFLNVERAIQKTINYSSFNLGAGFFIPLNEHFDFEVGYDYKYLTYEGVDTIAEKISYESNVNVAYIGFNVRF